MVTLCILSCHPLLHRTCPALPDSDTGGRVSRAPGRPLTRLWLTPVRKGTGLPDDVRFPSALTFYSEFRALVKFNFNKRIIWKILCRTSINRLYFLLLTTKGQMPIMQRQKTRSSQSMLMDSQKGHGWGVPSKAERFSHAMDSLRRSSRPSLQ